ncbi:MAG TPA: transposase zinc-binding domain-containing protein [Acetobacteraceae bacterium]|nr:transposase zinc-binding domain-containing protein [Acetobacteraceae bacterium]
MAPSAPQPVLPPSTAAARTISPGGNDDAVNVSPRRPILACRTEALGGHLWRCDECAAEVFSYHSCKNRSCPKCHTDQTERWLEARKAEMLPTRYFHVTMTVPEELREVLRANQRDGYTMLMKAAAEAIVELARDPRYVGGTVGVLAVLHTWTQHSSQAS